MRAIPLFLILECQNLKLFKTTCLPLWFQVVGCLGLYQLTYLLLKKSPPQRNPLLQLFPLTIVLRIRLHLDLALISIQQLQLLLQLHL